MQLRWTEDAALDLSQIANYFFEKAPEHAEEILYKIYRAPSLLLDFPNRGRPGTKRGTRELVITSLPYIIVFEISEDIIHVVRILHQAQKWPFDL
jgi:toxin ParE1/3/4